MTHFIETLHSGLSANELRQGISRVSYHMLAYCHKHCSGMLHVVLCLHKCCQDSIAAQDVLLTWQVKLDCSLANGRQCYVVTLWQHQGPQIPFYLLSKAVLAPCDPAKVLLGC